MKKAIDTLIKNVALDNAEYINNMTIADYMITDSESIEDGWRWYFDDEEIDDEEVTDDQIEEVKDYLKKYWDITVDEIA